MRVKEQRYLLLCSDFVDTLQGFDRFARDVFKVGTDCGVLGNVLPKGECVWVHLKPCGLVCGLGKFGFEDALEHFAGVAGAKLHGQHVVNGRKRIGGCVWQVKA